MNAAEARKLVARDSEIDGIKHLEGAEKAMGYLGAFKGSEVRILVKALKLIKAWNFDISGDCVAEAKFVAAEALENYHKAIGEKK